MADHRWASADLVSRIPDLRAYAISLCRSTDQSEDLVQDTLLSAWAHLDDFTEGTNLSAWLTTILRNRFMNMYRRQRLRREFMGTGHNDGPATVPNQDGWVISTDLGTALAQLPVHQRQAVVLVGANGLSLAEAAAICKCQVGTIKSRVSRARERLSTLLADDVAEARPRRPRRPPIRREARLMPHGANAPRRARAAGPASRLPVAAATQS